jgi:ribonuclease E
MLIDASHKEETRVAVVKGNRVEEFDFEAAAKKQLKGNIYLAKVTRVEPSLQAAFVDYGGNRHGFLAFSEIHPDYYQIPVADREALIAEEADAHAELHESEEAEIAEGGDGASVGEEEVEAVETGDVEDIHEELPRRPKNLKRRYKIQEVIKRRQVLLVQVVKEERGTKGAALTTYLSLAGRYCVLMPNTHHGGGVSRKIGSQSDRRKLKSILTSLEMPEGMGCIIRTAGLERTKAEIRRDFDYLMRTWDDIRDLTLESVAPALIYEEGELIKRAIRDLYNREIDEVLVEGEEGYKSAKTFMRTLMPSHARKVQPYKDNIPLFHRYQVEGQLDSMYNPVVQLKSGGYIVINPTEALVAIDVNSGKATKEHNIEETALRTNLETAEEVARQLRLRDMAGLIVIDFIDMEDRGNIRQVERRLKECLKSDRARIQVGRISGFGLMEMSRQRLRPGLLEASTLPCPHCEGTGIIRSTESSALHILRSIEEEGIRGRSAQIDISVPKDAALYILNEKRAALQDIESRYGFQVMIHVDDDLVAPHFRMERSGAPKEAPTSDAITVDAVAEETSPRDESSDGSRDGSSRRRKKPRGRQEDKDTEVQDDGQKAAAGDEEQPSKSKRRRRGRRGGRKRNKQVQNGQLPEQQQDADQGQGESVKPEQTDAVAETTVAAAPEGTPDAKAEPNPETEAEAKSEDGEHKEAKKKPARKPRSRKKAEPAAETAQSEAKAEDKAAGETKTDDGATEKPKRRRRTAKPKAKDTVKAETETDSPAPKEAPAAPAPKAEAEKPAPQNAASVAQPKEVAEQKEKAMAVPSGPGVRVTEVGSDQAESKAKEEEPKKSKKGWWRRPLGI